MPETRLTNNFIDLFMDSRSFVFKVVLGSSRACSVRLDSKRYPELIDLK